MTALQGVYTALITPFDATGRLDEDGLRLLIQRQIESGVDGITALGSTAETSTLSKEEQQRVISICRQEIAGRTSFMIGSGSNSTSQTIENTLIAQEAGADSALIVTPYYNRPTQEGLYLHFKAIIEAVDIPIVVYNVPSRTGQNLQTETLKRLMDFPSIIGIKDASGNIQQTSDTAELIRKIRPGFSLMTGDDAAILTSMVLGGNGVISVVSNLVPQWIKKIFDAASIGDFLLARQIHYELSPLFRAAFLETNPIPIKAAMKLCNLPSGDCRLPLCTLSEENTLKLQPVITALSCASLAIRNHSNQESSYVCTTKPSNYTCL